MQIIKSFYTIFPLILLINCSGIKFKKNEIIPNNWKGKSIRIADLEHSYKKKHRFNKVFSKFSSKRFIPYYKFITNICHFNFFLMQDVQKTVGLASQNLNSPLTILGLVQ